MEIKGTPLDYMYHAALILKHTGFRGNVGFCYEDDGYYHLLFPSHYPTETSTNDIVVPLGGVSHESHKQFLEIEAWLRHPTRGRFWDNTLNDLDPCVRSFEPQDRREAILQECLMHMISKHDYTRDEFNNMCVHIVQMCANKFGKLPFNPYDEMDVLAQVVEGIMFKLDLDLMIQNRPTGKSIKEELRKFVITNSVRFT